MATELGQAYVQIIPSAKGISGSIRGQLDPEATAAGQSAGSKLGTGLKIAAVAAVAATGLALGKAISSSLTEGAKLQQSLGGIETLFKGSADKLKKYANEAYKTTGLSANDYMENVTSFSASLLQSLGGDTSKAADKANMAMIDMSDNANKMGTNMEDIQNAYQGFAKQNYTMLDNLKLGYGGTKQEMERLLADATKLTGVKYDINNLADVYDAIHAVQGELDITGTTAKEAAETFSGSFSAMKAAFSNVLGKIALGMDIGPSLKALAETTATFLFNNFIPMVVNILKALPGAIMAIIEESIPYVKAAFSSLLDSISNAFPLLGTMIDLIRQNKVVIQALTTVILGAVAGFVAFKAVGGIVSVFNTIKGAITAVIGAFKGLALAMAANPFGLIVAAIAALVAGFVYLWQTNEGFKNAVIQIWTAISDFLNPIITAISEFIKVTWGALTEWWNSNQQSMSNTVSTVWNAIKGVFDVVLEAISLVVTTVLSNIKAFWDTWGQAIMAGVQVIWSYVSAVFSNTLNNILAVVTFVFNQIGNIITMIMNVVKNVIKVILSAIKGDWSGVLDGIKGIVSAFGDYIKNTFNNIMTLGKNIVNNGINAIKGFFKSLGNIDLMAAGRAIIDGFIKGLVGKWEEGKKFIGGIGDWIKKHKGPISYDKRLLIPAGNAIMNGLNSGLQDRFYDVKRTVYSITDMINDSFDKGFNHDLLSNIGGNGSLSAQVVSNSSLSGLSFTPNSQSLLNEDKEIKSLLQKIADKNNVLVADNKVIAEVINEPLDQMNGRKISLRSYGVELDG